MASPNLLFIFDETVYGPLYFSVMLTTAFYGVTCIQTFIYYVYYTKDSLWMKGYVAALWALDTIHEVLILSGVCKYIVAGLVNPLSIEYAIPELVFQGIPSTLISTLAQGYLVYRIYVFSGGNVVAPILWVIQAVYQNVAIILFVVKAFYSAGGLHAVNYLVLDDHFFTSLVTSCFALAAAVDVFIAVGMTLLIVRKRSTVGFATTEHLLERLTVFAVNTGTWTAAFAVLAIILVRVFPYASYYVVFATPLSSLYCNTLLANLNARTYIRDGLSAPHNKDVNASGVPMMHIRAASNDSDVEERSEETNGMYSGGTSWLSLDEEHSGTSRMTSWRWWRW